MENSFNKTNTYKIIKIDNDINYLHNFLSGQAHYCIFENDDYSNISFNGVSLQQSIFKSKAILPKNPDFFKNLKDKSIVGCVLPQGDYSIYDFTDVDIRGVTFPEGSILPSNNNLFQTIKNKSLFKTRLPKMDLSNYLFDGVDISFTVFSRNSLLPKQKNLFKLIKDRCLQGTHLPEGDFSIYSFKNVDISLCHFRANSVLPKNKYFFRHIKNRNINGTLLPDGDYTSYLLNGVSMIMTTFTSNSCISNNKTLTNVKDRNISFSTLPPGDYTHINMDKLFMVKTKFLGDSQIKLKCSIYPELIKDNSNVKFDLSEVNIQKKSINIDNIIFNKKSILPEDKNFFQNIAGKKLENCLLPIIDIEHYNLKDVMFKNSRVHPDSIIHNLKSFVESKQWKLFGITHIISNNIASLGISNKEVMPEIEKGNLDITLPLLQNLYINNLLEVSFND